MKSQEFNLRMLFPTVVLFLISNMLHQSQVYPYSPARFLFVLLGAGLALPLYYLIGKSASFCNEDGLFASLEIRYGRIVSLVFACLFTLSAFIVGTSFLRTYCELISLISLRELPLFFIALPLSAAALFLVWKGRFVLGRWSHFILPLILGVLILGFALSFKNAEFSYLKPFLYGETHLIPLRAAQTMLTSFSQGTLFLVPACYCKDREKAGKTLSLALLVGTIFLALSALQNILLLGPEQCKTAYFNAFSAFSLIDLSPLFQRMEILIFILLLGASIATVGVCMSVCETAISHMTKNRFRNWIMVILFLLFTGLSPLLRPNIFDVFRPIGSTWIYFIIFYLGLPIITIILLFWGARKKQSLNQDSADKQH